MATALTSPAAKRKGGPRTATCDTCGSTFRGVDRDEDGRPEVPESEQCAHGKCETQLCAAGCREISFHCDGCAKRFCSDHRIRLYGDSFCVACAMEVVEANEPQCTCTQTDVDLFSAARCELHNDGSEWNARLREVTDIQRLEEYTVVAA